MFTFFSLYMLLLPLVSTLSLHFRYAKHLTNSFYFLLCFFHSCSSLCVFRQKADFSRSSKARISEVYNFEGDAPDESAEAFYHDLQVM